jgi:hypothetical protein
MLSFLSHLYKICVIWSMAFYSCYIPIPLILVFFGWLPSAVSAFLLQAGVGVNGLAACHFPPFL